MTQRLATDRQIAYVRSLLEQVIKTEYLIDPDNAAEAALVWEETVGERIADPDLTSTEASATIDTLKSKLAYRKAKGVVAAVKQGLPPVEPGFYLHEDNVYRVVDNRAKTGTYAKKLDFSTGRWVYAGGITRSLTVALTPEHAAALGHQYGICVCCGAELSDPDSVARGIGPVCYKNLIA